MSPQKARAIVRMQAALKNPVWTEMGEEEGVTGAQAQIWLKEVLTDFMQTEAFSLKHRMTLHRLSQLVARMDAFDLSFDFLTLSKATFEPNKKPTRADLLRVLGRMQNLSGSIENLAFNDRDAHQASKLAALGRTLHALAISALAFDEPEASAPTSTGWGDASDDTAWERAR